jgi:predicted dehydrogenase
MKEKIKFGVIGCGTWGSNHAKIYSDNPYSKLVAVCDLNFDKANNLAKKFSVNYYTDFNKMLENEEIDAVGIATPDFAHAEPLIAAAKKGKNILCEKPIVTSNEELEKVVKIIKENKVRIMVDYHNHYNVPLVLTKNDIINGKLGIPVNAHIRLNDTLEVPAGGYISWAAKSSVIWFLGSHTVDMICWIMGDKIKKVYSVAHEGILKNMNINCVDTYLSTLEFEKGEIAHIENGWITPKGHPCIYDFKFNILCSKGMVDFDFSSSNYFQVHTESTVKNPDFAGEASVYGSPFGFEIESIRDFIKKLYFDEEFIIKFDDSIHVNKVCSAILESASKGEPVLID